MNNKRYEYGWFGAGAIAGACAMYLFDPNRGHRRRVLARDQLVHLAHQVNHAIDLTARDIGHRAQGYVSELKSTVESAVSSESFGDRVIAERVRSKIGRVVSHPRAIHVTSDDGRVTLDGPVLRRELRRLISTVHSVRGVSAIENRLSIHESGEGIPDLQGTGKQLGRQFEFLQAHWAPTARLVAGLAGAGLAYRSVRVASDAKNQPGQAMFYGAAALAGAALCTRAITDIPMTRLFKSLMVLARSREVHVRHSIHVNAPVEQVFDFWSNFSNFPRFMSYIQDVRVNEQGGFHWRATGPAGILIEWDAAVTRLIPNQIIAWKSTSGAPIENSSRVFFRPLPDNTTRLDIDFGYLPPAGRLGQAAALLFGVDARSHVRADLQTMKRIIESPTESPTESPAESGIAEARRPA